MFAFGQSLIQCQNVDGIGLLMGRVTRVL